MESNHQVKITAIKRYLRLEVLKPQTYI